MNKTVIMLPTMGLYVGILFAQCPEYNSQPPRFSDVVLECSVIQDVPTGVFTYRYSLTNGSTSTGCINGVDIDISLSPGSSQLSKVGLIDYPRYVDRSPLSFDSTIQVVPVGIPKLPSFHGFTSAWSADFGIDGFVGWFRAIPDYRLPPGQTLDSIIMTSHGLPGIRRFVVTPSYHPKPAIEITPENEDSVYRNTAEPTAEQDSAELALEESIKMRGYTIGPIAPPINFSPSIWLDTLISYKHQALNLGWITNQGIANSLDSKLGSAKSKLAAGDTTGAKNMLNAFVNEVEAQNGKHLSGEAYALLKFNAEYLIQRLK
jgi:hypothetical protein